MRDVLGARFVGALGILGGLVVLDLLFPEQVVVMCAAALVMAPIITGAATWYFTRDSVANPTIISLRERAQTSFLLFLASLSGAVLGVLVVFRELERIGPVPRDVFLVGLTFALLLVAGPAFNGLVTWLPRRAVPQTADDVTRRLGGHPPVGE